MQPHVGAVRSKQSQLKYSDIVLKIGSKNYKVVHLRFNISVPNTNGVHFQRIIVIILDYMREYRRVFREVYINHFNCKRLC